MNQCMFLRLNLLLALDLSLVPLPEAVRLSGQLHMSARLSGGS